MATTVPRRVIAGTPQTGTIEAKIGGSFTPTTDAPFLKERLSLFEARYAEQEKQRKELDHDPIQVVLPDGKSIEGRRHETTPMDVALGISKGLASAIVVAKVTATDTGADAVQVISADDDEEEEEHPECCGGLDHGLTQLWDLTRPLEYSCELVFLKYEDAEAQHVFWHSSAHILGEALERLYGTQLGVGPALEQGFYYDCYMGDVRFTDADYPKWMAEIEKVVAENQPFERLVVDKSTALKLFENNPFKTSLIQTKVPEGGLTSVYRCGSLIDLCRGPHIPSTGRVKAFMITKHSSTYWLGKTTNDTMQRVYGISFPEAKQLKNYQDLLEQAKLRDHRALGLSQNLFFFNSDMSPGSCFWLPDGTKIYNKLCDYIREEYRQRGFSEVLSPNIFSCDIFKVSGHYQNYKDNMYILNVEGKEWGLKPMNCPGHCLMFRHMRPSYRQLPLRLADFGVLHRNEVSGSLTGLTRVRRFQQDDAHIFCRLDQVADEVKGAMDFLLFVYKNAFNFDFDVKLATRPKKALGEKSLWDEAERQLAEGLDQSGLKWSYNHGDGAFYGPKIDIRVRDALERWHQCGTIQLDFQLPLRFDLQYQTAEGGEKAKDSDDAEPTPTTPERKDTPVLEVSERKEIGSWESPLKPGYARPVMVHRAILGSVERMTAVLVEHTGGRFPFWLAPRQVLVCPISEKNLDYARWVEMQLASRGYEVGVDSSSNTINKKIRQAQVEQWYYILVVGQQEQDSKRVMVRKRDSPKNQEQMTIPEFVALLASQDAPHSRKRPEELPDWQC